jgi:hypothetical protein
MNEHKKLAPATYAAVRKAKAFGFNNRTVMKDYGITMRQLRTIMESKPSRQYTPSTGDLLTEGYTPEEIARHFGK